MSPETILVTGASGMLGAALVEAWQDRLSVYATGGHDFSRNRARRFLDFDLTSRRFEPLKNFVRPDVIVNCAALSSVEVCERHPETARAVNAHAVSRLADAFPAARMIQISTDAVYAPEVSMAREGDALEPASVYGRTKLEGEAFALAVPNGLVLRTTVVGWNRNSGKKSFLEWLYDGLACRRTMTLFADVFFTPLTIWDFAGMLEFCIRQNQAGTFNVCGGQRISKYEFGMALAKKFGLSIDTVQAGTLAEEGLRAPRRLDQSLNNERFECLLRQKMPGLDATMCTIATMRESFLND